MIPHMRTGLLESDGVGEREESQVETVLALLRVFAKDAMTTAGRYAISCGRSEVTGDDMKRSLMFSARTFFEKSDVDLNAAIDSERAAMEEEEEEEDEDEEDEEEDEEEDAGDEEDDDPPDPNLRRNVDTIAEHWDKWHPEDPVHMLLKRAIDNTPV